MFDFQERDEGFLIHDSEGRAVASLQTTDYVTDGELRKRLRSAWEIHYAGNKLTLEQNQSLLSEIAALPE